MEVKHGYRHTEVGIIPEDWDVGVLGDLTIKVGSGITPTGGEKVYKNDGRPFIRSQNVGWGNLLLDDIAFIDEETHASFSATEIQLYDVLLNITGASIGRSAVSDKRIECGNVNQHVCIIRTDKNKLVPHYINLFLLSKLGQKQIDSFQTGGNRQGLNFGQIKSFRFPLPPPPEQRAIAAALSDVDSLLATLDELIAKKRFIKQGTVQKLLSGNRRLRGSSDEWKIKKLGDLCTAIMDGTHFTPTYVNQGVPFYSVENVTSNDFINTKFISLQEHNRLIKRCKPEKGDILMTRIGSLGDTRLIDWDVNASIYVSLALLKVNKEAINENYLYTYTKSRKFIKDVELRSLINAIPQKINMKDIGSVPILVPSPKEQIAIAETLSDMNAEIAALEARREKTSLLKQGMMQELLTGKTRLV